MPTTPPDAEHSFNQGEPLSPARLGIAAGWIAFVTFGYLAAVAAERGDRILKIMASFGFGSDS